MPTYGGQALIEGVLMRGRHTAAAAFRAPDGNIVLKTEELQGIYRSPWMKLPFLRGIIGLWDALGLGMRYLTHSANLQSPEDEKIEGGSLFATVGGSLLIAALLFFAGPALFGQLSERFLGITPFWGNMVEGLIRLAAVIGYIWLVGKMPEIARVFAYHGAEHKTINAFEDGAELTPDNVLRYSLEHPRCGTAFLLTLVVFSIIIFTLVGPLPTFWRIASRLIFLPAIAGLAYEYIRFTANFIDNPIVKWMIKPNLALQHLTTREPDRDMVEVAITAFNTMREQESAYTQSKTLTP
jgi:uncharacterized protein YqhQ